MQRGAHPLALVLVLLLAACSAYGPQAPTSVSAFPPSPPATALPVAPDVLDQSDALAANSLPPATDPAFGSPAHPISPSAVPSETPPLYAANTYSNVPTRAPYSGVCDCPYDTRSDGSSCGASSAYSRPGGRSPACYSAEAASGAGYRPAYQPTYSPPYKPTYGSCAENGSCYGDVSNLTGRPKTVAVRGYFRKNGTYVRGHYRSRPRRRW